MKIVLTLAELHQLMELTQCSIYVEESLPQAEEAAEKSGGDAPKSRKWSAAQRKKFIETRKRQKLAKAAELADEPVEEPRAAKPEFADPHLNVREKMSRKYGRPSMVDAAKDQEAMDRWRASS